MTYALAWELQRAVFARLTTAPAVTALIGDRIYDAAPPHAGPASELYVTLGDETVKDRSTATTRGAAHQLNIAVTAPSPGFGQAKQAAAAICDALLESDLPLGRGRVIVLTFRSAETERGEDDALRRIVLSFRALLEDTA
ncbi:MAG: DUF3168 domain-containing protein [Pikeienuella sp.]